MKIKTSIQLLSVSFIPFLLVSCGSVPDPDPDPDPTPVVVSSLPVKPAETILKDLGLESLLLPNEDRIVGLEKSLSSSISLKLQNGSLAQSAENTKQIEEIKKACRVKEPDSFLLVVKSSDSVLLAALTEIFSKDPAIECVGAGSTATADQIDLVLKLY